MVTLLVAGCPVTTRPTASCEPTGKAGGGLTEAQILKAHNDRRKEVEKYNYTLATNACDPGAVCGHYTQVVWAKSLEVGCAVKYCSDKNYYWQCNYGPGGNVDIEKSELVLSARNRKKTIIVRFCKQ